MKKLLPLIFATLLLAGCGNTEQQEPIQLESIQGPTSIDSNINQSETIEPTVQIYFNNRFGIPQVAESMYSGDITFHILTGGFSKNQTKVFFKGVELFGIDPATFQVIDSNYAKDKNYVINVESGYDSLYIVSDDPVHFPNNNKPIMKQVMLTGLQKKISIPQGRTATYGNHTGAIDSLDIVSDSVVHILSGGQDLRIPIKISFIVDTFEKSKMFYDPRPEDEGRIASGELVEFSVDDGMSMLGYGLKIGKESYIISIHASANIPEGYMPPTEDYIGTIMAYGRPATYWDIVSNQIQQSVLSLKK